MATTPPEMVLTPQKGDPASFTESKVFLGGLGPEVNEDDLISYFRYGPFFFLLSFGCMCARLAFDPPSLHTSCLLPLSQYGSLADVVVMRDKVCPTNTHSKHSLAYTNTYTHADTHADTHTQTHTHTNTLIRTHTHAHAYAHAHTHAHAHAHARAHAHTHTHTHTYTHHPPPTHRPTHLPTDKGQADSC